MGFSPLTLVQIFLEFQCVIFSVIIASILLNRHYKEFRGERLLAACIFMNIWLLLSDILHQLVQGSSNIWGWMLIHFANYSVYLTEFIQILLLSEYVYLVIRTVNKSYPDRYRSAVRVIMTADILLLLSNPWTRIFFFIDEQNRYLRSPIYWLSMLLAGICIILMSISVFQNQTALKENDKKEMFYYAVLPLTGGVLQIIFPQISFLIFGITIATFIAFEIYMKRLTAWRKQRDLTILKSQAYLLNSQIKPHFLFNSLNVIQSLIEEDPDTAVVAVNRFSKFLRTGLKIEVMDSMVPIKTELDYVDDYLYLETLRHGDKIQVIRDIDTSLDFQIPFLTLQPIVENAVRHGICKRIKGGTIAIDIKKANDFYEIRIVDDGVGFLPLEKEEKEWDPGDAAGSGVGMNNVRNRLAMMCGGTMEIDSVIGKGTMVLIRIPVK